MKSTIIYYSSNQEDTDFEKKVQNTILKNSGRLPIVSVTQKPTDFGLNICIGEVGASGFNMLRQVLIACEAADTEYVVSAEADCLYGPDYFQFQPTFDNVCYRNDNTYLMGLGRDYFWKKNEGGTWAQVINREYYIERLHELFEGESKWDATKKNFPKEKGMRLFDSYEAFTTEVPCVSIKSGKGMRNYSHSERIPITNLPFWGSGQDVRKKYL